MGLNTRLTILKDAGQISTNSYTVIQNITEAFKNMWKIELNEENGAMFITHLAVALSRIEKKEVVEDLAAEIYAQLKEHKCFQLGQKAIELMERELGTEIPESERGYIMIHLCTLFEKEGK